MYITIGQIINTHGIKGELKVRVYSDSIYRFEGLGRIFASSVEQDVEKVEFHITGLRYQNDIVLMKMEEIKDLTEAEKVKGYYLQILESELPPLPEGRYYIYQLEGLMVWEKEVCYGELIEVMQPGNTDVYVVSNGKREILIPALKTVIKSVDLEKKQMEVELPAGLQEIYESK